MDFYQLPVKQKIQETNDTVTLTFDIEPSLQSVFQYKQGQYVTIKRINGERELRRSYSMSSSPLEGTLAVTVKKVSGGRMSTWLHDEVKVGDVLEVAKPEGRFYNELHADKRRTYYLFGSGSGITPLKSIIQTILEAEPMSTIYLLYGSRDESQIIFKSALDRTAERYAGQFQVTYMLSSPAKTGASGGLFGLFKKSLTNWEGKIGRITGAAITEFLDENMASGPESDCFYYLCGPGNMAEAGKATLLARGIPEKQIYTELFVNADHVPGEFEDSGNSTGKKVVVHLKGERIELPVPDGATILDVLVKAKYDAPYSCTAGACSTCMAKVISGTVAMDACYALDDQEIKAGYILTCQSKPTSQTVEITYD